MSFIGKLSVFDHKTGDWLIFKGKLTKFLLLNSIEDSNKSAVLLTYFSDESYRLLRNLVYPDDIETKTYKELVDVLDKHFKPKQCSFVEKAKFYGATRSPGETLGDWAARLRGLACYCEFGTALDMVLLDRFVLGLGMGHERDKLFEQDYKSLTFAKALEIAEKAECAREAKKVDTSGADVIVKQEPVFRVGSDGRSSDRSDRRAPGRATSGSSSRYQRDSDVPRCIVCGMKNHNSDKCRYKSLRCQKCGEKGHLKKVCKVRVNCMETQGQDSDTTCQDCKECELFNLRFPE
ncbi:uncharacterized protein LOC134791223 [Cydia splendana]|uniref:uncharacterized protein LOC134791223 n=1 Tax=Cydia splendana TaxID=1100963 RepID=UPI00300D04EE